MKITPSQQKYIDMIKKNHKTDVEVSDRPGTGIISIKYVTQSPGVFHNSKISRLVTPRGRVIR